MDAAVALGPPASLGTTEFASLPGFWVSCMPTPDGPLVECLRRSDARRHMREAGGALGLMLDGRDLRLELSTEDGRRLMRGLARLVVCDSTDADPIETHLLDGPELRRLLRPIQPGTFHLALDWLAQDFHLRPDRP